MEAMSVEAASITNQRLRRLKRVEYDQLVAQGAFANERVELLFGMVVAMSPVDPRHVWSTAKLHNHLAIALGSRAQVIGQSPIAATDDSEPEPDIYVAPNGAYYNQHASRAHLIVEVANTSLAYDRGEKALLYGSSEVEEYWIVDLVNELVEVRRDRDAGTWRSITTYRRGDTIHMLAFPMWRSESRRFCRPCSGLRTGSHVGRTISESARSPGLPSERGGPHGPAAAPNAPRSCCCISDDRPRIQGSVTRAIRRAAVSACGQFAAVGNGAVEGDLVRIGGDDRRRRVVRRFLCEAVSAWSKDKAAKDKADKEEKERKDAAARPRSSRQLPRAGAHEAASSVSRESSIGARAHHTVSPPGAASAPSPS